jgi:hypothetical protein
MRHGTESIFCKSNMLGKYESIFEMASTCELEAQGYCLLNKTESRKSRGTAPLTGDKDSCEYATVQSSIKDFKDRLG